MYKKIQASNINIQKYCLYSRMLQLDLYSLIICTICTIILFILLMFFEPLRSVNPGISMRRCREEILSPSLHSLFLFATSVT